jgi:hypothetical protein
MQTMKPTEFRVLLDSPAKSKAKPTEHTVRVLHGDMLRAELEGPKHGIVDMEATPMHFTTLWIWASLVRTHVIEDGFKEFKPRLLQLDEVADEPDDANDPEPVDPTRSGAPTG